MQIQSWELILTVIAMVLAAISGGAFFAFSNFVMKALAELEAPQGVLAMQAINRAAPNPLFVAAIVGSGLVGVPLLLAELGNLGTAAGKYLVAGMALSMVSFAITMTLNVPRNNALDRMDPVDPDTAAYWSNYLKTWTMANTARGLASLASVACYALWLT